MMQFKSMFKDTPWITIPTVYKEYSTENYITMEYIPCIKINDITTLKAKNFKLEAISIKLIECYVDQIIKYGLIHIDPHPGNLGITDNGKLVFYDYGMILELDPLIKNKFDDLLVSLYDKDVDKISKIILDMELVVIEKKDLPYLKKFLLFFISYIETVNIDTFKISYLDTLNKSDTPFLISSKFLLLLRGISILEGNCKLLDPTFNYTKTLNPYINKYLIDIRYIENKSRMDISMLTSFPAKMKEQQIEMDIMKMNLKQDSISKDDILKRKAIIIGSVLILSTIINKEIDSEIIAGILSTVLLF
jgi:predicted unusual protein kinase regulating ubiquinone biosynthesis (AarF/ABC1/UbiB family)